MNKILLIISFAIYSCSGSTSSFYNSDYPLTNETAYSRTKILSVKVPQEWFVAEDNEFQSIDLWLVKDDYTATLNLTVINLDSLAREEIKNKGLEKVSSYSKAFVRARLGKTFSGFSNEEVFEIGNNQYAAYQYIDNEKRNIRVIVFQHNQNFFEFSAIPNGLENLNELYRIQNSVLSSIN